jgi:hypothetical protein
MRSEQAIRPKNPGPCLDGRGSCRARSIYKLWLLKLRPHDCGTVSVLQVQMFHSILFHANQNKDSFIGGKIASPSSIQSIFSGNYNIEGISVSHNKQGYGSIRSSGSRNCNAIQLFCRHHRCRLHTHSDTFRIPLWIRY